MIITCPQCDTRFVVPSTIFMRGGRQLKCSSCKHKWFQEEPLERVSGHFSSSDNDVPSSNNEKTPYILETIKRDFTHGYIIISTVFIVVIAIFFAYYFLKPSLIIGQGLVFEDLKIERQEESFSITGNIINAMDADRGVPSIAVTTLLENDIEGDTMIFFPEKDMLASGETMPLAIQTDMIGPEVINLNITFKMNMTHEGDNHD